MAVTIQIAGMNCGGCVKGLKAALEQVPGITALEVQVGKAVVEGNADLEQVKSAITARGFQVVSVG